MKYVMVTSWPNHWDKTGNKSSYSYSMLKGGIMDPSRINDHTPTIFIRIDKETRLLESAGRENSFQPKGQPTRCGLSFFD